MSQSPEYPAKLTSTTHKRGEGPPDPTRRKVVGNILLWTGTALAFGSTVHSIGSLVRAQQRITNEMDDKFGPAPNKWSSEATISAYHEGMNSAIATAAAGDEPSVIVQIPNPRGMSNAYDARNDAVLRTESERAIGAREIPIQTMITDGIITIVGGGLMAVGLETPKKGKPIPVK